MKCFQNMSEEQWIVYKHKTIAILLTLLLLFVFLLPIIMYVRFVFVIGESMEPTLSNRNLVFTVLADNNPFITIERNDIVVVQNDQMKDRLIKRVIAIPGDTLEIKDNQIYLNGECLKEPFVLEPMVIDDIPKHKLKDEYFVMGDNRNISKDSRQLGGFAKEDIFGVVQVTNPIANVALLIIVIMVMYGMGEVSLFLSQKVTQRWMPLPESDPDVTSESESDPKEDEAEHVLHGDQ